MATEITCATLAPGRRRLATLGGPGWQMDAATLIGEIEAGCAARRSDPSEISSGSQREVSEAAAFTYFVRLGLARVSVTVVQREGRRCVCTDPEASAENHLLSLPSR